MCSMERIKTHRPDMIKKYFEGVSVEDIASAFGFTPQGIYKDMRVYSDIWHLRLDRLEKEAIEAYTQNYLHYYENFVCEDDHLLLSSTAGAARALERLYAVMHFREKRLSGGTPIPQ